MSSMFKTTNNGSPSSADYTSSNESASIHSVFIDEIHHIPMNDIICPLLSVPDEGKVRALMEIIQTMNSDEVPPIDVLWYVAPDSGNNYYFSMDGYHRWEYLKRIMSTTTTVEPKKESLGITAALILSLVGLTLLLVIGILIKREIRRGNVKSKRDGHFWSCKFFRKYTQSKLPTDGKITAKVRPQWLLVGHHELPERFYTKYECPQYIARMFTIDLHTVLQHTCRETYSDINTNLPFESYLITKYPSLAETIHSFRRLKIRAEVDLVPFTIEDTKNSIKLFNQLLQKLSEFVNNPYLRQRQITLPLAIQNDEQQIKMSSKYIPLLPKDLCQIPLRPIDDDSLANMNKRSRSKGRFPFHLPSFLNKRRFFSTKSSSITSQTAKNRNESSSNYEISMEDTDNNNSTGDNPAIKTSRQRFNRQTATDAIPLVEFHDALPPSTSSNSNTEPQS